MTARAKPQQMCFMRIGFEQIIMPLDKGLKVMELLQHAVDAEENYGTLDRHYAVKGPLNLEMRKVMESQIAKSQDPLAATTRAPRRSKGSAEHCAEGVRCVCGGDTAGVRATCPHWRGPKGDS